MRLAHAMLETSDDDEEQVWFSLILGGHQEIRCGPLHRGDVHMLLL